MSDLIRRQDAIDAILECCSLEQDDEYECGFDDGLRKAIHKLKHLPSASTVDAVKHGEWFHCEGDDPWDWTCSACMKNSEIHGEHPNFCPNCGAKMDRNGDNS